MCDIFLNLKHPSALRVAGKADVPLSSLKVKPPIPAKKAVCISSALFCSASFFSTPPAPFGGAGFIASETCSPLGRSLKAVARSLVDLHPLKARVRRYSGDRIPVIIYLALMAYFLDLWDRGITGRCTAVQIQSSRVTKQVIMIPRVPRPSSSATHPDGERVLFIQGTAAATYNAD